MKSDFSSLAFVARQNLVASGVSISLGHTQQLLSASLGYGSLAAIQASTEEAPGIAGADFVILDVAGLSARTTSLGYGAASDQITDAIVSAIKSDPEPPAVFLTPLDFIEDVAGRFANDTSIAMLERHEVKSLLGTKSTDAAEASANVLLLSAEEFETGLPFKLAERHKILLCVVALDTFIGNHEYKCLSTLGIE